MRWLGGEELTRKGGAKEGNWLSFAARGHGRG